MEQMVQQYSIEYFTFEKSLVRFIRISISFLYKKSGNQWSKKSQPWYKLAPVGLVTISFSAICAQTFSRLYPVKHTHQLAFDL